MTDVKEQVGLVDPKEADVASTSNPPAPKTKAFKTRQSVKEELDKLTQSFKELRTALYAQVKKLSETIVTSNSVHDIQNDLKEMFNIQHKVEDVYVHIHELDTSVSDNLVSQYDDIQETIAQYTSTGKSTISELRMADDSSTTSSNSESHPVHQDKIRLKREAAAMTIKLEYLEKQKKMEKELEALKLERDIAMKKAESEICTIDGEVEKYEKLATETNTEKVDRYFSSTNQGNPEITIVSSSREEVPVETVVRPVNVELPVNNYTTSDVASAHLKGLLEIAESNRQLAAAFCRPKFNMDKFGGDPLEYHAWDSVFTQLVETTTKSGAERLNLLNDHVINKPKQSIKGFIPFQSQEAYLLAREKLKNKYGNDSAISSAFTKELNSWKKIGNNDTVGLSDFADFLSQLNYAKTRIKSLQIYDFAEKSNIVIEKLPNYIANRWKDVIYSWRTRHGHDSYPDFQRLTDFVQESADKENIPELSLNMNKDIRSLPSTSRRNNATAFESHAIAHGEEVNDEVLCLFCEQNHPIADCITFTRIPHKERKAFFMKNGICFGCGVSKHHIAKDCKNIKTCTHCDKRHLTCMHFDRKVNSVFAADCKMAMHEKLSDESKDPETEYDSSMIIPVYVRNKVSPDKTHLCYVILDNQSNTSFVSEDLMTSLNLKGVETELSLTTLYGPNKLLETYRIKDIEILPLDKKTVFAVDQVFTRPTIPCDRNQIPTKNKAMKWNHLNSIVDKLPPYYPEAPIAMLIGRNLPGVIRPINVVAHPKNIGAPFAQESVLGWGVVGLTSDSTQSKTCHFAYNTVAKDLILPHDVRRILESDFVEKKGKYDMLSQHDKRFMDFLETNIVQRADKHYEMPLPFKHESVNLPDNYSLAYKRLMLLKNRFKKNPQFKSDYVVFMNDVLTNYAEKVKNVKGQPGKVNFIPHSGVYHPKKPGKIRVVFDCSAQFSGTSLNEMLLSGPDLTNNIVGIISRFRLGQIAFTCDIKSMFHQFFVTERDRDFLRFLWFEDETFEKVVQYRMKVHLFGASSSPGCANYGLKQAAKDGEMKFGEQAAQFLQNDFYVDDGLKSLGSVHEAVNLIENAQGMCNSAGLCLNKFTSNSEEVLNCLPEENKSKIANLLKDNISVEPFERVLGIIWSIENDQFKFRIDLKDTPLTRRGILSTICSIFDPISFLAPVLLGGKHILQLLCEQSCDWDDPIPSDIRENWSRWRNELFHLEDIGINRCYNSGEFGKPVLQELHFFSDASSIGYGQCTYLRSVDESGRVECSLVIAKSRVTPIKKITIPRLELNAAVLSAKMSAFLRREMKLKNVKEYFWVDSQVVLGYIKNPAKRFHTFVANRVEDIREVTSVESWNFIDGKENVADLASRGTPASKLSQTCWFTGPKFLTENCDKTVSSLPELCYNDLNDFKAEVKQVNVLQTGTSEVFGFDISRLNHISSWYRAKRAVANCMAFMHRLKFKVAFKKPDVDMFQKSENEIIKSVQMKYFGTEVKKKLSSLDPFYDEFGILRVGGRLGRKRLRRKRIQYLSNVFWTRWKNEFLLSHQRRNKWNKKYRNIKTGDTVLLSDSVSKRNVWNLARVVDVYPSSDEKIRKVKLQLASTTLNEFGCRTKDPVLLDRPIHKLVLLVEDSPDEGASQ